MWLKYRLYIVKDTVITIARNLAVNAIRESLKITDANIIMAGVRLK